MVNKKSRRKKINKRKVMIVNAIIVVLLCIGLNIFNKCLTPKDDNVEETENEVDSIKNEEIVTELKNKNERERIEFYFSEFLGYIEDNRYDKAYDLLNSDFKTNYFPTQEEFEEYVDEIFSPMTEITFDNIERNGEIYVLWIYVTDTLTSSPSEDEDEKDEMNIVIKENGYNDFELSFSVIDI